jgi:hypothetical protein
MLKTPTQPQASTIDEAHDARLRRRRMESEVYMLQSDRSRFVREEEAILSEIRMIEKAIAEKEMELDLKHQEKNRIAQKIQETDIELLRLKRESYKRKE